MTMKSSKPSYGQAAPVEAGAPPAPSGPQPSSGKTPKRHRWLLLGCGGLLALLLLVVVTVAVTFWWIQRPIKPVVLSDKEKAVVRAKLDRLGAGPSTGTARVSAPNEVTQAEVPSPGRADPGGLKQAPERRYVPGGKTLKLTEREINGLLNANSDLGQSVRIEFDADAINAYVVVPIPKDFPVGGGRMFRACGRFRLSIGSGGAPLASLEDVTVLGLSLPKAWLGGLKGENLLGQAMGGRNGRPVLKGIKSLRIEPGALVLEVED